MLILGPESVIDPRIIVAHLKLRRVLFFNRRRRVKRRLFSFKQGQIYGISQRFIAGYIQMQIIDSILR